MPDGRTPGSGLFLRVYDVPSVKLSITRSLVTLRSMQRVLAKKDVITGFPLVKDR